MRKAALALLILALSAQAASLKLYLKDGNFHVAREYQVQKDRVRFFSLERGDWEEIPLDLVDVRKTEAESSQKQSALAEEAKIISAEDKAARALQDEILKIPQDAGVYMLENSELKIFHLAESSIHTNKGRSLLKAAVPIPLVTGKATVEIPLDHASNIITNNRPDLYIQLSAEQRYGIVRLTPHRGVRIVERVTIVPVTKDNIEEMDEVEIFRKQLTEGGLFKIWPQKPLENGEYAVVEYTAGKLNLQIWDFAVKAK